MLGFVLGAIAGTIATFVAFGSRPKKVKEPPRAEVLEEFSIEGTFDYTFDHDLSEEDVATYVAASVQAVVDRYDLTPMIVSPGSYTMYLKTVATFTKRDGK